MDIRLVIFDIAGTTLVDKNYVGMCIQQAFTSFGTHMDEAAIQSVMGWEKPVAIRKLLESLHSNKAIDEQIVNQIHESYLSNILTFFREDPRVKEIEGTTALFEQLRASGIKIGLDTGFDRKTTDIILDRVGWRKCIDASVTSDEVANGRPAPDMGLKLMELTEVDNPAEVAKIGDTASDLQEGEALGCRYNIGVTSGAYQRGELEAYPHTHIIDSIRDLPKILNL